MPKIIRLLLTTMGLALLSEGCSTTVHDFQACSPFPGSIGASCDWFLHKDPQTLNEAQWQALILSWQSQGQALECTTSGALAQLKAEIEQLCSSAPCSDDTQQKVNATVEVLDRMIALKDRTALP
jgi:hypothetical protein